MALPKVTLPSYTVELPLSKKKIKIRPYNVEDEKLLLTAVESKDVTTISDSMQTIIQNCISGNKGLDVKDIADLDLQYIFLQLRIKSVGETTTIGMRDPTCEFSKLDLEAEGACPPVQMEINLTQIPVVTDEGHTTKIILNEEQQLGVVMKYPTIGLMEQIKEVTSSKALYDIVAQCIENVFDADEVYTEFTREEMVAWVSALSTRQFGKLMQFFESQPRLKQELKYNCPKCNTQRTVVLEGLLDFFT